MRVCIKAALFVFGIIFTLTILAETDRAARKAEVEAFVKDAVAYVQKVGKDKAVKEFSTPGGKFHKGELYIYAYYYRGPKKNICVAHGLFPDWVGKDRTDYLDPITKARIVPIFALVMKKGGGWVTFHFEDPISRKIKVKYGYAYPVPGADFYVGSGYYIDDDI